MHICRVHVPKYLRVLVSSVQPAFSTFGSELSALNFQVALPSLSSTSRLAPSLANSSTMRTWQQYAAQWSAVWPWLRGQVALKVQWLG